MGLDYVELVMAVEEALEIEIEDEEAQRVDTVGDLHRLAVSKLEMRREEAKNPVVCARVPAFNRIRRALIDVAGVERSAIRPATPIDTLVSRSGRREAWEKLAEHSGLRWPQLTAPAWLLWTALAASAGACVAAYLSYRLTWSLVLVLGAVFVLILKATKPLQVELQGGIATMGDLTRAVAGLNYILLTRGRETLTPEEVWDALVEIIVRQLSIDRSEIRPEASFSRDLRVD